MSAEAKGVTITVRFTVNPGAIVGGVGLELSDGCVSDEVWERKLVSESSPGQAIFGMAEDS